MGRAARARIEAQFTLAHMLDRAEHILGRVAAGRPAVAPTAAELPSRPSR
jgi:hypothetical protein